MEKGCQTSNGQAPESMATDVRGSPDATQLVACRYSTQVPLQTSVRVFVCPSFSQHVSEHTPFCAANTNTRILRQTSWRSDGGVGAKSPLVYGASFRRNTVTSPHLALDDDEDVDQVADQGDDKAKREQNENTPGSPDHREATTKSNSHGHSDSHFEHVLKRLDRLERHLKVRARGSLFASWCKGIACALWHGTDRER